MGDSLFACRSMTLRTRSDEGRLCAAHQSSQRPADNRQSLVETRRGISCSMCLGRAQRACPDTDSYGGEADRGLVRRRNVRNKRYVDSAELGREHRRGRSYRASACSLDSARVLGVVLRRRPTGPPCLRRGTLRHPSTVLTKRPFLRSAITWQADRQSWGDHRDSQCTGVSCPERFDRAARRRQARQRHC